MAEIATSVQKAKEVLLRALENLENAEQELEGEPERVDLIVVYSIGRDDTGDGAWHEVGGWSCTAGPQWTHAAMLRRAADAFDLGARTLDDDDDGDEPD